MRRMLMAGLAAAMLAGSAGVAGAQTVVVERWGHWDPAWGADPGPPPRVVARHWRHRENHWYEHVHRCMVHERYNPRRDMYFEHRRWVTCRD